jgi:hypothetical protein
MVFVVLMRDLARSFGTGAYCCGDTQGLWPDGANHRTGQGGLRTGVNYLAERSRQVGFGVRGAALDTASAKRRQSRGNAIQPWVTLQEALDLAVLRDVVDD